MSRVSLIDRSESAVPAAVYSRREALRYLSASTLLALGLWPGRLRADNEQPAGSFRFHVINDTHCVSPECAPYLQGAVAQMKRDETAFCLHLGDLSDKGDREHIETVREIFKQLPGPMYPVIGNHDYLSQNDRSAYTAALPTRINYHFSHGGWQFVGLDTTEGLHYEKTSVSSETLRWLDDELPRLERRRPTVIFTHFPMGAGVNYRPLNAEAVLERFLEFNLQAVYSGHFHAFTERTIRSAVLTTNSCCSLRRDNHDGTKEKGYFVCQAQDGRLQRSFVEYKPQKASA
jgi:3',5'-cyclic AMP phosphodiesterase CpdA